MEKSRHLQVHLPDELHAELERLASESGTSPENVVISFLNQAVHHQDDVPHADGDSSLLSSIHPPKDSTRY